jgi:hypothetical protein
MYQQIHNLPIAILHDHPENERLYGQSMPSPDLVASISEKGVLQPLLVTPLDFFRSDGLLPDDVWYDCHEAYVIVSGHRRKASAIAAGLDSVPCVVRLYPDESEILLDLVESNYQRRKTERMVVEEFETIEPLFKEASLMRRRATLRGDDDADGNMSRTGTHLLATQTGRTRELMAQYLGVSSSHVRSLQIIFSRITESNFLNEVVIASHSLPRDRTKSILNGYTARVEAIRQKRIDGGITMAAAEREVAALREETLALIKPKRGRPKSVETKLGKVRKPYIMFPYEEERFELEGVRMIGDSEYLYGYASDGASGTLYPAVSVSGQVLAFPWSSLIDHYAVPMLKKLSPKQHPIDVLEVEPS